jgi:hypothetical protein
MVFLLKDNGDPPDSENLACETRMDSTVTRRYHGH